VGSLAYLHALLVVSLAWSMRRYETTASNVKELLMQLDRMRAEPELRRALSKRGLRYAMERHSPEVVAHQYITQVASVASMR
jgi:spore maturation protein CgeB